MFLSIYILFLQLSFISIFITSNWLNYLIWTWDMIWDMNLAAWELKHGLSSVI